MHICPRRIRSVVAAKAAISVQHCMSLPVWRGARVQVVIDPCGVVPEMLDTPERFHHRWPLFGERNTNQVHAPTLEEQTLRISSQDASAPSAEDFLRIARELTEKLTVIGAPSHPLNPRDPPHSKLPA